MEKKNEQSRAVMRTRILQFAPPTLEEVVAYHAERKVETFEAEEFFDQYEARGWCLRDGSEIYSWKALLRQWVRQRKNDYLQLQMTSAQRAQHYPSARNFAMEQERQRQKELERQRIAADERERQQQERERIYEEQRKAHVSYEEYLRMKGTPQPLHFGTSQKLGGDNTRRKLNDLSI